MTFVVITLARVATLASGALGAGLLGWPFAIGLGVGVYLCSYWLKVADNKTRTAALFSLVFFALADLVFNTSEVYRGMLANNTWGDGLLRLAGIVYAAFPTLAVGLLGWLQGRVDRLPPATMRKSALLPRIKLWFAAQIDANIPQAADAELQRAPQAAPHAVQRPQVIEAAAQGALSAPEAARRLRIYECACGRTFASQPAYAAHRRHCAAQAAEPANSAVAEDVAAMQSE
jgi:hypothetical protein